VPHIQLARPAADKESMLGKWLRDLTWKQRFAEKCVECDELRHENKHLVREFKASEKREKLASIAERIYLQKKASREETGGPICKCTRCAALVFALEEGSTCAHCELELLLDEAAERRRRSA
jgi:hypothetical protein